MKATSPSSLLALFAEMPRGSHVEALSRNLLRAAGTARQERADA